MSSIALADRLDQAIKVLIASSNGDLPTTNPKISGLRRIAAELRSLPSPDFKADLKAQLLEHALGGPCGAPCFPSSGSSRNRPCPLFSGAGRSGCPVQGSNLVLSFLAHAAGVAFLLSSGLWMAQHKLIHQEMVVSLVTDSHPYSLPGAPAQSHGGGGGGDRDKFHASRGHAPRFAAKQALAEELEVERAQGLARVGVAALAEASIESAAG